MSLIVFDMGRRVETPGRPTPKRVEASAAIAATRAIDTATPTHTGQLQSSQAAIQAYQEQNERHPAVVSFIKDILHREVSTLTDRKSVV